MNNSRLIVVRHIPLKCQRVGGRPRHAGRSGKVIRASLVAMLFVGPAAAAEAPHVAPIRAFAIETVSQWIADPTLIEAVRAQNIAHARFGQVDIDALDQQWRDELDAGSQMLIGEVLSRPLSAAKRATSAFNVSS